MSPKLIGNGLEIQNKRSATKDATKILISMDVVQWCTRSSSTPSPPPTPHRHNKKSALKKLGHHSIMFINEAFRLADTEKRRESPLQEQ
jgi:hypothetical protein